MPNATVTIRELKNKNTCIDLAIPNHKDIAGLLSHTIEYHVVVVSQLSCFKTAAHKDMDVVQFMIAKYHEDFEDLRKKLTGKFPGLQLPTLPGKGFTVLGDSHAKERRLALEKFLSSIASVPKTAHSSVTLEFLGVNSVTANSFSIDNSGRTALQDAEQTAMKKSKSENLFGEEEHEEGDLFGDSNETQTARPSDITYSAQLFESAVSPMDAEGKTKLFEEQDFGGAVTNDEADLFLIPGASDNSRKFHIDLEDNSDLLNIEDDLEKLLNLSSSKKSPTKPAVQVKPKISTKPAIPQKPKLAGKPALPAKSSPDGAGDTATTLDASDIFKYIQENEQRQSEDLDLFS